MRGFARILKPGGHVLLRLPAYQWLHGRHDQLVHTFRRYTRGELVRMLRRQGFELVRTSYANCFLFPLAAAKRLKDRVLPPKQEYPTSRSAAASPTRCSPACCAPRRRWCGASACRSD